MQSKQLHHYDNHPLSHFPLRTLMCALFDNILNNISVTHANPQKTGKFNKSQKHQ